MPRSSRPRETARKNGELALIEHICRRAAAIPGASELVLGIGDDCAILRPRPGEDLVVTTDFCMEGRHWKREWNPPQSAGHRTLARGLSDLAAMGARPVAAFLSLALPAETSRDQIWTDGFLDGLLQLAIQYKVPLAGGDTSESPSSHVLADIVCLGAVPQGEALRRSGARPGDALYCTGTLGGSFAERTAIAKKSSTKPRLTAAAAHPFLYPQPRLAVGEMLRERSLATACIDLSDGLSTDLHHLCIASAVGAEVHLASLPASRRLKSISGEERPDAMLHGGEDYELLFTTSPEARLPGRLAGVPLTRIGTMVRKPRSGPPVTAISDEGRQPLAPRGWEHLK